jgi:hypothetical protein
LWFDAHDHGAWSFATFDGNRLETQSEIAARYASMARELWRDALDGGRWDDEHASTRPKNRHADRRAGRVQQEAAFGAPSQS